MCSIVQNDILGSSIDKDMHCKRIGQIGANEYLRKNCYQQIKCTVANSLAAFMWKRLLNSTALVTLTHKGSERVFDGTSTQVAV